MKVAKNLKNNVMKYRAWKGLTRKQLAKEVRCSENTLALTEYQKTTPSPALMYNLCQFFNVSENQLFYKEA